MLKAVYYARVSTSIQEERGTIESQKAELTRQIKRDGNILVDEYIDAGWSGGRLDRPALDKLRQDTKTEKFEVVYFLNTDRIARKTAYQMIILSELLEAGKKVIINGKSLQDDPENNFLMTILGAVSELEKAKISERTSRGRMFKARQGLIMSSHAPYGYDLVCKTEATSTQYVINKSEACVVKKIFNWYSNEQLSIRGVIKSLYNEGINARSGKTWKPSSIRRILSNTTYIGTTYYNKNESFALNNGKKYRASLKTGRRMKDKCEWIPIKVTAIISENQFKEVQDLRVKNFASRRGDSKFILTGLLQCECGCSISGEQSNKGRYYRCTNRHRKFPAPRTCTTPMANMDKLDATVLNAVKDKLLVPSVISKHIKLLRETSIGATLHLNNQKQRLLSSLDKIERKKAKLFELYSEDGIDKSDILGSMAELNKQADLVKEEIKRIQTELLVTTNKPVIKKTIEEFCALASRRFESLGLDEKRRFLNLIIEKILYQSNRLTIRGIIPQASSLEPSLVGQRSQGAAQRYSR